MISVNEDFVAVNIRTERCFSILNSNFTRERFVGKGNCEGRTR